MPEPEPPSPQSDSSQTARLGARCEIQLQNPGHDPDVGSRRLRPWLTTLVAETAPEATTLAVRFVSDREMRQLNSKYRNQDKSTDVLSFPGDLEAGGDLDDADAQIDSERDSFGPDDSSPRAGDLEAVDLEDAEALILASIQEEGENPEVHLGDIVIAMPTARRQAAQAGHSVERELRTLLLHGVLHCLGYDHETDDGTMERLEQRLRQQWIDHE